MGSLQYPEYPPAILIMSAEDRIISGFILAITGLVAIAVLDAFATNPAFQNAQSYSILGSAATSIALLVTIGMPGTLWVLGKLLSAS